MARVTTDRLCAHCKVVSKQRSRKLYKQQRRARVLNLPAEPVRADVVYQRDGWNCGICTEPVNPDLRYPHPLSASLDHVVPLSRGGHHTYANTQTAHLACNMAKSDKVAA